MVYTIIDLKVKHSNLNHKYATFRSYKKFNENVFIDDVKKSFVKSVFDNNDINASWEEWKCKFLTICDKHAPIRKMRVKNKNTPWIDNEVLDKMYERDFKHKKAVTSKNEEIWNEYKTLRNDVTQLMRQKRNNIM